MPSIRRARLPKCLRALAHADSSLALVASMHPAVLFSTGWLARARATPPYDPAWQAQRQWAFRTAREGAWWGTIVSEPGTGGDASKSKAIARPDGTGSWRLTGQKHFGSGAGITSYMMTSAVPVGEEDVETFFVDVRGAAWDGSGGMKLTAPWDGCGMIATQSHAFAFENFPVTRVAWPAAGSCAATLVVAEWQVKQLSRVWQVLQVSGALFAVVPWPVRNAGSSWLAGARSVTWIATERASVASAWIEGLSGAST